MRIMYDSINPNDLPSGADLYAGYDDGNWPDASTIQAKFAGKTVIRITTNSSDNEGDCLDVENGDASPIEAPAWVSQRRSSGLSNPLVYCAASNWQNVINAFNAQQIDEPSYWIAAYPGTGANIPPGAVAHQYQDIGPYDVSVVVDYLPGIDPAPTPNPPIHYSGDNMLATPATVQIINGKGWIPSPVPTAQVVNVVVLDENPEVVDRYDSLPQFVGSATGTGPNSPNGALVFESVTNGTFGVVIWSIG